MPLLCACQSVHKQGLNSQSMLFLRNCNKASISSSSATMRKMDQKLMSNPKGMTKTVETNQDLSSVHGQVPATKDRGTNPSCPLRNCNIAVCFVKQCHGVQNRPKHIFDPKRKDAPCPNQSRPLLGTCRMARKQGCCLQSITFMR